MKDPFHYIPPTPTTAPKYAAIRTGESNARDRIGIALNPANNFDRQAKFDHICEACREFADLIESTCPQSADTTTAIRSVRLVRMRANESVTSVVELDWRTLLTDARMWACAAVALADEPATGGAS